MSTRNLPGGKKLPARKADNFTAICEPIIERKWGSLDVSALWASMAYYRDTVSSTEL
jgi:hypothetical protein